jgi:hypothetical protein
LEYFLSLPRDDRPINLSGLTADPDEIARPEASCQRRSLQRVGGQGP